MLINKNSLFFISGVLLFSLICAPITTKAHGAITVPNVFTPNNDGVNDEFTIDFNGHAPQSFRLNIYSGWGTLMFSSGNSNVNWNGLTTSGVKAPNGTYFYVLEVNGIEYKGYFNLFE